MYTPFSDSEDLTALAASCYPVARFGATCIEVDVLDFFVPTQRRDAEAVVIKLRSGALFDKDILSVLHDLLCLLDVKIVEDTTGVPLDARRAKKGWDSWQDGPLWRGVVLTRKWELFQSAANFPEGFSRLLFPMRRANLGSANTHGALKACTSNPDSAVVLGSKRD